MPATGADDDERELRRRDLPAKFGAGCLGFILGLIAFLVSLSVAIAVMPLKKDGMSAISDGPLALMSFAIAALPPVGAAIGWRSAVPMMRKNRHVRAVAKAAAEAEQPRRDLLE